MSRKKSDILITKASGEKETFSEEKLRNSLKKAGANEKIINNIISEISDVLSNGITTREIYKRAFSQLRKASTYLAAKYKLKKAIQELGPSGYPFEKYIGEILKYQGFQVEVGQMVQGQCVSHEVDVIAEREEKHFMIECKFHNEDGKKCHVKTPLYIHSRFLDIEKVWKKQTGHAAKLHQGWLVTNTKFSRDAIEYGVCVGLKMISWDFPEDGSLRDMIDASGLHPLTCLPSLTGKEKQMLLDRGFVLCRDIISQKDLLLKLGLSTSRIKKVVGESIDLCEMK